ncbi:predicted protein [Uncinocarpus reesii 1704]|uniref:Uncharacterized protein n=1 Tax=Uncinocarpus reesii (strain UAMH 1704) TaxID=336963 RepID=C4JHT5_UNCRE|nr:uncharacterized protein UREG_02771 [Uncinocarpus reesii 1704]EEP77922.1 predicted protein [Uncinocarpus reesii 1704]
MACPRAIARNLIVLLIFAAMCLELVSGRPHAAPSSSTVTAYNTAGCQDIQVDGQAHQLHARALPANYESFTKREKLIIGLGAGFGGFSVLLSVLIIVCYLKSWHRTLPSKFTRSDQRRDAPRSMIPQDTFQHHHRSMFSIGTPKMDSTPSYDPENALQQTCPYHPGLPSPMTSYYQPVEVYRTLIQPNKHPRRPVTPISEASQSPTSPVPAMHPAHYRYIPQNPQNTPEPPTPADSQISPKTIPRHMLYAPQPRRVGLPSSVRQSAGLGIAVLPPPPAVKVRPLPLRDYSETR